MYTIVHGSTAAFSPLEVTFDCLPEYGIILSGTGLHVTNRTGLSA